MWRRVYLLLILVRIFFALTPSYIHPDENFQGPEVIAGQVFTYPVHLTWEFTSSHPVRSVFPLWIVYGIPMMLLRWVWLGEVPPAVAFWTLRALMFLLSFVIGDWAIQELVPSPQQRRTAVLLVASSYVTWTYQTHTFSNSIETLLVAWSLVLIERINEQRRTSILSSSILGFLVAFGIFNRITFPAFLLIPGLRLIPHFSRKPLTFAFMVISGSLTALLAIVLDTAFYSKSFRLLSVFREPIITPLNNLVYNMSTENLANHGLHPYWQHIVANLPQLLGPAYLLLFKLRQNMLLASAVGGIIVLSLVQHQEARFLVPAVPLILASVELPLRRSWIAAWIVFNVVYGVLMGMYHQGGVVPAQLFLSTSDATHVVWWKTYSPPIWLLDGKNEVLKTEDLMGAPPHVLLEKLHRGTYLIAPLSATFIDKIPNLERVWSYRHHLNLDDLDWTDGIMNTLHRVVGRRGLAAWIVR